MKIYTESEAQNILNTILSEACIEGTVGIRKKDGQTFIVRPEDVPVSPLDVQGVNLPITTEEIIGFIHEARKQE
jgi:hypothetical protein